MKNNSRPNAARRSCHLRHHCHLLASLFVVFFLATVVSKATVAFVLDINSSSHPTTTTRRRRQQQQITATIKTSSTALFMGYDQQRSSGIKRSNNLDRTKRQERVGHVVRTELATLLHRGVGISSSANGDNDTENNGIGEELRQRINIVHANVSPDLRQARVTISILSTATTTAAAAAQESSSLSASSTAVEQQRIRRANDAISRRRAYAWLVSNTKAIRHALSKRMSHMKGGAPELTFVQVDVGNAVDVMNLIDKVSNKNYKREKENFDDMLRMGYDDEDDDYEEEGEDDDDGWVDDDDDEDEEEEDYDDDDEDYNDYEDDNAISMNSKGGKIVKDMVKTIEMEEMDDDWVDFDDVE